MGEVSELSETFQLRLIVHPKTARYPVKTVKADDDAKKKDPEDPPISKTPKPGAWKMWAGGKYDDYVEGEEEKEDNGDSEEKDVNDNHGDPSKRSVHFVEVPLESESPMKRLRENVADHLGVAKNAFLMTYRGMMLEDEDSFASSGLEDNATVHVFPAILSRVRSYSPPVPAASRLHRPPPPPPVKPPSPPLDVQRIGRLSFALQSAFVYPRFQRQTVLNMLKGEKMEHLIAATPGLKQDREAIALLSDPLFVLAMTEVEALKAVWKRHFCLIEALEFLAGSVHADPNSSSLAMAGSSNRNNDDPAGDLDSLSDEDVPGALMGEDDEEADDESGASGSQQEMDVAPSQAEGAVGGGARPRQGVGRGRRIPSPGGAAAAANNVTNRGQRRRRPRSGSDGRGGLAATRPRTMPSPGSQSRMQAGITQEALAAALRSITGAGSSAAAGSSSSSPASSMSAPPPRPPAAQAEVQPPQQGSPRIALPEQRITTQMFQDALNRALSASGEGSNRSSTNPSSSPSPARNSSTRESTPATASESSSSMPPPRAPASRFPPVSSEREAQVRMLEELGFFNPAENLQALEATNGDVSAAVGLILSMRES